MEDNEPALWGVIWMGVALAGLVAIILGKEHHIITVILGTIMLMVTQNKDNNQTLIR